MQFARKANHAGKKKRRQGAAGIDGHLDSHRISAMLALE
jgi:hypothetical protein